MSTFMIMIMFMIMIRIKLMIMLIIFYNVLFLLAYHSYKAQIFCKIWQLIINNTKFYLPFVTISY